MNELFRHLGLDLTYQGHVLGIGLVMARLVPCVTLVPFLGGKQTPSEIKIALVMMFTVLSYAFVYRTLHVPIPQEPLPYLTAFLKELFIGLSMGIITQWTFDAFEMTGRMIDTMRGSNMAEAMVPEMEGRATLVGDLLYQYAVSLSYAMGVHRIYILSIMLSFERLPLLTEIKWLDRGMFGYVDSVMRIGGNLFMISLGMALPAIGATFIIDCVFGLLNRVAPQLNAYHLAMPVKAMGGLVLLFVSLSMISSRFEEALEFMLSEVQRVANFFG